MPSRWAFLAHPIRPRLARRACPCPEFIDIAFSREVLEVSDVSREFPFVSVLKFSMSARRVDTLRYTIECRLPRRRADGIVVVEAAFNE
jgi:hypothetical protein